MDNKEKLAKEYSEGSNELYNTLIKLWDNNFETIGCCKGHDNSNQYIGFNRNNNDLMIKLLSLLKKDDIIISFLYNNVSIKKNKNKDIYQNILNALDNINNNVNVDKDIEKIINFIDNNNYGYVNIHLYYNNGSVSKYINTSDINLINVLNKKYEYEVLNDKLPMYHFIIK